MIRRLPQEPKYRINERGGGRPVKCFHSFRHNFADGLKQAAAEPLKISELLGHGDENISTGRHSESYISEVLFPVVYLLDFELNHESRP